MKRLVFLCSLCLLLMTGITIAENAGKHSPESFSPNHLFHAIVKNVLPPREVLPESVVSIYDAHGKLLCTKSYLSPDHEHGFGVVQIRWSADSRFCVWSLTSSGGHSPWHFPTDCYIQKCHSIVSIDNRLNASLTQSHFKLQKPHTLLSQRLIPHPQGEMEYAKVQFNLNDLKCP